MKRPSLPGARPLAAALLVGAASALGLLPGSAAAAVPATALATATTLATASAPAPAAGSLVGGVIAPIGGGVLKLPTVPVFPGLYTIQAMPLAVTIGWFDRSNDEQKFVLYRRDLHGAWQAIYEIPTRNVAGGGDYSYVDTDRSVSGQCYMVAAVNQVGAGYTSETCTVRPDPSRFPQNVPAAAKQWDGLSSVNDGTGNLQNFARSSYTSLTWSHQTFGVDLDWSEYPALWKIEAQGGPHLMRGQAVALRVWGGGWLKYGHETWGINLVLSDTPSYEWYVLAGTPGLPIDSGDWALWNSAAGDYLVSGDRTWGVNLVWYEDTLPAPQQPPPPPQGVKTFVAYNCISEQRPLEMWVADLSAGTGYVDRGQLGSQWSNSACPEYTGQPWTFTPVSGHQYLVRSVDYLAAGCANDPTLGACWRSQTTFVGDANGQVVSTTIG